MNDPLRFKKLEFLIESSNGKIKEPLELIGRNIEFESIVYKLREKRNEYIDKHRQNIRIVKLKYFEEREVPESIYDVLSGTIFSNTKLAFVLTEAVPLIDRIEFRRVFKKNVERDKIREINRIDSEITLGSPYKEWLGYMTMSNALGFLFHKYASYLKK